MPSLVRFFFLFVCCQVRKLNTKDHAESHRMCTELFRGTAKRSNVQWFLYEEKRIFLFVKVIDTIAHAIAGIEGVALLDIDPGLSTNRTIYSMIDKKSLFFLNVFLSIQLSSDIHKP